MEISPTSRHPTCTRCAAALPPEALACSSCHALVHAASLERLAAQAREFEQRQELVDAREVWAQALTLLPPQSAQAQWVTANIERLQAPPVASIAVPASRPAWVKKLGPVAPLALVLAKGKFLLTLFKLKFLLSLGTFVAFYWALYGMKFGVGFAALVLLHEIGHFLEIRRRGLPADMPVFLPGFGAYVRWAALGVTSGVRAFISLAGPMAGTLGAAVCALLWTMTDDKLWLGLASLSAVLNVLNLVPVWVLDGGQAMNALDRTQRVIVGAMALIMAVYFHQPLFLLVAAGAAYRLFTKDLPAAPNAAVTAYYVCLLTALGFLIDMAPSTTAAFAR